MSRPRTPPLALVAGALLLVLVFLFFVTHRPLEPLPDSVSETAGDTLPAAADNSAAIEHASPEAPATDADLAFASTAAALSEKLSARFTRPDTRAHEAVLIFKNDDGYRRFLARAAQVGVIVAGQIDALQVARVRVRAYDTFAADLLARAADFGGVSANTYVTMPPAPALRNDSPQYAVGDGLLASLGVAAGTDTSAWGRGVVIAILDGGASPDPSFGPRLRYLDIGLGYSGTGESGAHGTSVASVAAGSAADARGVAPAASVLSIRVIDTDGKADVFTVAQGIVAAVDAGARIINLSLGGYSTSEALSRAVVYAAERGSLVVAAAGNDGVDRLVWPAADPRVVSVGATDATGRQASFSNAGPTLVLSAPGVGIRAASLAGGRKLFSGTSAAAPVVSGALAVLLSQDPALTAPAALEILKTHSDDGGSAGPDAAYGYGGVDLGWALARSDPARVDTAVSSHHYDAETGGLVVVLQNRSARPVSGLSLAITLNDRASTVAIPSLAAGQSLSVPVPLDAATAATPITLRTRLDNPEGVVDALPVNNTRASLIDLSGR